MTLHAIRDRIIVRRLEAETRTPGGLVIPDQAKEKPVRGVVLSAGPGTGEIKQTGPDTWCDFGMQVGPGDEVIFGRYAGTEIEFNGEKFVVLREDDVLAVVKG